MTSPLRSTAPVAPARAPRTDLRTAGRPTPRPTARQTPRQAPRPAPARRPAPRHLRVVEAPAHRGRRIAIGALVVLVVFGALLSAAVVQSMLVTGQDRIDTTNREIEVAERALQRERAELATAESPEQLALAAARIGMVTPGERDWIPADSTGPSTVGDGTSTDGATTSELAAPAGDGTDTTDGTR